MAFGKIVQEKTLEPKDVHVSIRGTGKTTLVVAGSKTEIEDPRLLAVLFELVREAHPTAELPDAGPGLRALSNRVRELTEVSDVALTDHQTLAIELAEAKQRIDALEADARESE